MRGAICPVITRTGSRFITTSGNGGEPEFRSGGTKKLRRMLRKKAGRHTQASAACLDSQSVKTVDTARRESIGYDAGKRIKGRKRHILVDTPGLLITVTVHAADISETADGKLVLAELIEKWWRLRLIRLDGGYMAGLFEWVKSIKRGRECWRV